MKRTLYLITITVITLLCIAVGIFKRNTYTEQSNGYWQRGENEQMSKQLSEFNSIEADVDVVNLTIKEGDEYAINCNYSENCKVTYSNENQILKIEQQSRHLGNNNHASVIITIPKEAILENINLTNDVGDIKLIKISSKNLTYTGDVGNLKVESSNLEVVVAKSDIGDIEFDNIQFQQMAIENDIGDVEVESTTQLNDYYVSLETSLGEVEVNGKDYGRKYNNNNSSDKSLKIKGSTGDVELKY